MSRIDELREAGFSEEEIHTHVDERRVELSQSGFSEAEMDEYYGLFADAPEPEPEPKPEISKEYSLKDRYISNKTIGGLDPAVKEEVYKEGLKRQATPKEERSFKSSGYTGGWEEKGEDGFRSQEEIERIKGTHFSVTKAIKNVPRNIDEIITGIGSLVMVSGKTVYNTGSNIVKDLNDVMAEDLTSISDSRLAKQIKPVGDIGKAIYTDWGLMFKGKTPTELNKTAIGHILDPLFQDVDELGVLKTFSRYAQEKPVDALLTLSGVYSAVGTGAKISGKALKTVVKKSPKIVKRIDNILSTKRAPIQYKIPALEDGVEITAKTVDFARTYSENPLTKYIFQKNFDVALEKFPKLSKALSGHKAKKLTSTLRNTYNEATNVERNKMHDEIFSELNKLTPDEQALMIPYLEGRINLIKEPTEQFKGFERFYRKTVTGITDDLVERGKLTPEIASDRIYQPLTKSTGLDKAKIIEEMGDFTPAYVHHFFPEKVKKTSDYIKTTGESFKPGFLKKSKGVIGYSEDLNSVLPKWTADYIKFKNTEAFLDDFLGHYGIKVDLRNAKKTKLGIEVDGKLYKDYKIIAPDNHLAAQKQKTGFYKGVSEHLDESTFDEAMASALDDMRTMVGVEENKMGFLVQKEMVGKLDGLSAPIFGSAKAEKAARLVVDKPVQFWKDSVLAYSPRWIKNNVVGDIMLNSMEGVGVMSYGRSFQKKYNALIPDQLVHASFANLMKGNPKLGKAIKAGIEEASIPMKIGRGIVKPFSKGKDLGYAVNTMCERPFVRSLYIKLARDKAKGILKKRKLTGSEDNILKVLAEIKDSAVLQKSVIDKVKDTLPVFDLTGSAERIYMKRLVPFYNWFKFMGKYGTKLPATHPFKTIGARGLGALSENEREKAFKEHFPFMAKEIDENGIPSIYTHLWPTHDTKDGKTVFFNARGLNPFSTIQDIANLDVMNTLSPLIKIPLEQITGQSTFTEQEFKSGEEGVTVTSEDVGYKDFAKVRPPLLDHVLNQFPQATLLKQIITPAKQYDTGTLFNPEPIIDKETGEYKYPIDGVEKAINYLGLDKKTVNVREMYEKYKQRKRQALGAAYQKGQGEEDKYITVEGLNYIIDEIRNNESLMRGIEDEVRSKAEYEKTKKEKFAEKLNQ